MILITNPEFDPFEVVRHNNFNLLFSYIESILSYSVPQHRSSERNRRDDASRPELGKTGSSNDLTDTYKIVDYWVSCHENIHIRHHYGAHCHELKFHLQNLLQRLLGPSAALALAKCYCYWLLQFYVVFWLVIFWPFKMSCDQNQSRDGLTIRSRTRLQNCKHRAYFYVAVRKWMTGHDDYPKTEEMQSHTYGWRCYILSIVIYRTLSRAWQRRRKCNPIHMVKDVIFYQ
jgi:hypothetical protein